MPDIIDWLNLALGKISILPPISEGMKRKMHIKACTGHQPPSGQNNEALHDQCVSGQTALFQTAYGKLPVKGPDDLVSHLLFRTKELGFGDTNLTARALKNIVEFVIAHQPRIMQVTSQKCSDSPWVTRGHATGDPGDILAYFKRGTSSLALDPIRVINVPEGTEKQRTELIVEKKKLEARIKEIKTELRLDQ